MRDDNVPTSSQWPSATTTTAVPARSRPTHHEEASLSWWLSVIACKIHAIKKYMQVIYRIFQAYIKLLFPRQRYNSENCDVHSAYGRGVCMLRIMRTAYNCTPTVNSKRQGRRKVTRSVAAIYRGRAAAEIFSSARSAENFWPIYIFHLRRNRSRSISLHWRACTNIMHLYCYCLTQHNNLLTSWLKKKIGPKSGAPWPPRPLRLRRPWESCILFAKVSCKRAPAHMLLAQFARVVRGLTHHLSRLFLASFRVCSGNICGWTAKFSSVCFCK